VVVVGGRRERFMDLRMEDWEERRREMRLERAARLAARGRGGGAEGGIVMLSVWVLSLMRREFVV
jgi:hypothetical protein